MKRGFILLLDSFGIGALPDADKFNDAGANTLRHIAEKYSVLKLPNLTRLGLNAAVTECNGTPIPAVKENVQIKGAYGYAAELSYGKDTTSGHWEIAGVPALFEWGCFPPDYPSFPKELVDKFIEQTKIPGILGNKHASGTVIIEELGDEHIRTGKPIVYTSADSVFQIAAHEKTFGLNRLYEICEIARKLVDSYNIGRVIARPFSGKSGNYDRTDSRRDYSVPPPAPTLLDKLKDAGGNVIAIGKVSDIFAHQGITKTTTAYGNEALFDATIAETKMAGDKSLIFTNFIDFDMKYGHRRDIEGYAKALEAFDTRLPDFEKLLKDDDIAIITADHGCDPTYKGTDHTREYIPILVFGPNVKPISIGKRNSYADIGQTLTEYFDLSPFEYGKSFLDEIKL